MWTQINLYKFCTNARIDCDVSVEQFECMLRPHHREIWIRNSRRSRTSRTGESVRVSIVVRARTCTYSCGSERAERHLFQFCQGTTVQWIRASRQWPVHRNESSAHWMRSPAIVTSNGQPFVGWWRCGWTEETKSHCSKDSFVAHHTASHTHHGGDIAKECEYANTNGPAQLSIVAYRLINW